MGQLLRLWTYVKWERKILNGWRENNIIISTRWFSLHNFQVLEDVILYREGMKYHEINFIIYFNLGFSHSVFYFPSWFLCVTLQSQYFDMKANILHGTSTLCIYIFTIFEVVLPPKSVFDYSSFSSLLAKI